MTNKIIPFITLKSNSQNASQGFTLVEIMIVVVILGVFSAIVSISVGSGISRKNVQHYDLLMDDLKLIRFLALQEQKVLGLKIKAQNATRPTQYQFVGLNNDVLQKMYDAENADANTDATQVNNRKFGKFDGLSVDMSAGLSGITDEKSKLWLPFKAISQRTLPEQMRIQIEPLESQLGNGTGNSELVAPIETTNPIFTQNSADTPNMLWFGNGEATPMKLTVFVADKQVGDAIFIDRLGRVTTNSAEAGL